MNVEPAKAQIFIWLVSQIYKHSYIHKISILTHRDDHRTHKKNKAHTKSHHQNIHTHIHTCIHTGGKDVYQGRVAHLPRNEQLADPRLAREDPHNLLGRFVALSISPDPCAEGCVARCHWSAYIHTYIYIYSAGANVLHELGGLIILESLL